jgi:predicted RNase H-like HicB family nuclease
MSAEQPYLEGGGIDLQAQPIATMDPTVVDEIQSEIDDAISAMEKEDVFVDPIFLLLAKNEDISENYLENTLQEAKKQIKQAFDLGIDATSILFEEINEALDEEIETWLEKYRKSQTLSPKGGYFHVPLLDNQESVDAFDRALGRGRRIYVQTFKFTKDDIDIDVEDFETYGEAAKFINDNTIKFFKTLGEVIKLSKGTIPVLPRPVRTKGIGRDTAEAALLVGGTHLTLPQKMTEADADRLQKMDNIIKLKEKYYFEPLEGDNVLLDDKPGFYYSREFQAFRDIVGGSITSRAKKQLRRGAMPNITTRDYMNMNAWITKLQDRPNLLYEDKLIDIFENALEAFINFWTVAVKANDETNLLTTLNENVTTIFGEALYEIALETYGSDEAIENIPLKWAKKPLKYWREQQEEKGYTLDNLLTLIDSEEYDAFIQKKIAQDSKIYSKHKALVSKLKKGADVVETGPITHAMLEATDMLRKMNNMKVYYSNLDVFDIDDLSLVINVIKKEHGLDIYAVDIHNIVASQSSFNDIAKSHGIADEVVYKIKGLFR